MDLDKSTSPINWEDLETNYAGTCDFVYDGSRTITSQCANKETVESICDGLISGTDIKWKDECQNIPIGFDNEVFRRPTVTFVKGQLGSGKSYNIIQQIRNNESLRKKGGLVMFVTARVELVREIEEQLLDTEEGRLALKNLESKRQEYDVKINSYFKQNNSNGKSDILSKAESMSTVASDASVAVFNYKYFPNMKIDRKDRKLSSGNYVDKTYVKLYEDRINVFVICINSISRKSLRDISFAFGQRQKIDALVLDEVETCMSNIDGMLTKTSYKSAAEYAWRQGLISSDIDMLNRFASTCTDGKRSEEYKEFEKRIKKQGYNHWDGFSKRLKKMQEKTRQDLMGHHYFSSTLETLLTMNFGGWGIISRLIIVDANIQKETIASILGVIAKMYPYNPSETIDLKFINYTRAYVGNIFTNAEIYIGFPSTEKNEREIYYQTYITKGLYDLDKETQKKGCAYNPDTFLLEKPRGIATRGGDAKKWIKNIAENINGPAIDQENGSKKESLRYLFCPEEGDEVSRAIAVSVGYPGDVKSIIDYLAHDRYIKMLSALKVLIEEYVFSIEENNGRQRIIPNNVVNIKPIKICVKTTKCRESISRRIKELKDVNYVIPYTLKGKDRKISVYGTFFKEVYEYDTEENPPDIFIYTSVFSAGNNVIAKNTYNSIYMLVSMPDMLGDTCGPNVYEMIQMSGRVRYPKDKTLRILLDYVYPGTTRCNISSIVKNSDKENDYAEHDEFDISGGYRKYNETYNRENVIDTLCKRSILLLEDIEKSGLGDSSVSDDPTGIFGFIEEDSLKMLKKKIDEKCEDIYKKKNYIRFIKENAEKERCDLPDGQFVTDVKTDKCGHKPAILSRLYETFGTGLGENIQTGTSVLITSIISNLRPYHRLHCGTGIPTYGKNKSPVHNPLHKYRMCAYIKDIALGGTVFGFDVSLDVFKKSLQEVYPGIQINNVSYKRNKKRSLDEENKTVNKKQKTSHKKSYEYYSRLFISHVKNDVHFHDIVKVKTINISLEDIKNGYIYGEMENDSCIRQTWRLIYKNICEIFPCDYNFSPQSKEDVCVFMDVSKGNIPKDFIEFVDKCITVFESVMETMDKMKDVIYPIFILLDYRLRNISKPISSDISLYDILKKTETFHNTYTLTNDIFEDEEFSWPKHFTASNFSRI